MTAPFSYIGRVNRRRFLQATGALLGALASRGAAPSAGAQSTMERDDPPGSVTLFFGGDVMTGRGIDQILPHPSDPVLYEGYIKSSEGYVDIAERVSGPIPRSVAFDYIWGDALEALDSVRPDFRIVNLETSVTASNEPWPSKGINYRMHPGNVPALTAAGIDCCVLANNHVLDWCEAGLEETLASLRDAGIETAGAGRTAEEAAKPAAVPLPGGGRLRVYSAGGRDSGIPPRWAAAAGKPGVNFLGGLDPASTARFEERIRVDKRPGDLAVASLHWGGNWGYDVPEAQRTFARRLVNAGADVIHGHSSHHAKGIEVIDGKPVICGAGDLINDYEGIAGGNDAYRGELPLLYFVTLNAADGTLERLRMQPMRIYKFRLQRASDSETAWLRDTLDREGRRFNTGVELSAGGMLELQWDH